MLAAIFQQEAHALDADEAVCQVALDRASEQAAGLLVSETPSCVIGKVANQ
jgi:hypothetical protein